MFYIYNSTSMFYNAPRLAEFRHETIGVKHGISNSNRPTVGPSAKEYSQEKPHNPATTGGALGLEPANGRKARGPPGEGQL